MKHFGCVDTRNLGTCPRMQVRLGCWSGPSLTFIRIQLFDRDMENTGDPLGDVVIGAKIERAQASDAGNMAWSSELFKFRSTNSCNNATGRVLLTRGVWRLALMLICIARAASRRHPAVIPRVSTLADRHSWRALQRISTVPSCSDAVYGSCRWELQLRYRRRSC